MKLSCVIPAHNEEDCIKGVILELIRVLDGEGIDFELVVVDDNSSDRTGDILDELSLQDNRIRPIHRKERPGFGFAISEGLNNFNNDTVCIVMGDGSDVPEDVVGLFKKIQEGFGVVYGSRFMKGNAIHDYPFFKLFFNRCGNYLIKTLFFLKGDTDFTNAFKIYRREVIEAIKPINCTEFNITLEIPLKAHFLGFKRTSIPVSWYGRKSNISKFTIFKMCKCYLRTLFKLWIYSVSGKYRKKMAAPDE
ncbi:glycosyltransferase family 2 protein [Candidatus Omnitrophota bacterium]